MAFWEIGTFCQHLLKKTYLYLLTSWHYTVYCGYRSLKKWKKNKLFWRFFFFLYVFFFLNSHILILGCNCPFRQYIVWAKKFRKQILYARHYNLRFVYFLPTFWSVRELLPCKLAPVYRPSHTQRARRLATGDSHFCEWA